MRELERLRRLALVLCALDQVPRGVFQRVADVVCEGEVHRECSDGGRGRMQGGRRGASRGASVRGPTGRHGRSGEEAQECSLSFWDSLL